MHPLIYAMFLLLFIPLIAQVLRRVGGLKLADKYDLGWVVPGLLAATGLLGTLGSTLIVFSQSQNLLVQSSARFLVALGLAVGFFVIVEYGILRLLSLFRLGAIVRVTYYEALLQPFTLIILAFGVATVVICAFVPFFTLNEDAKMYRDVGMSFCFLFTLPIMIFAASKVVDEEIENRTMLTLMSKPVARWQVVVGKYLGVLMVCLITMVVLGIVVATCAYLRYFDDMRIDYYVAGDMAARQALNTQNYRAIMALGPSLILAFLQIATLAAISVAISTRWGLALNITAIVLLYILANLTQFVDTLGLPSPWQGIVATVSHVLPRLGIFDINQRLIYGQYLTASDNAQIQSMADAAAARDLPYWSDIWKYVGMASAYGLLYISAALCAGVALFRTRELS